ncbi:MAG: 50S ribosomal protein L3, partial [Candidatus Bathyarchaeia archaeon]
VTVIQTPPLTVFGIRGYVKTAKGFKAFSEAWTPNPPKGLERLITLPKKYSLDEALKRLEGSIERLDHLSLLMLVNPRLAGKGWKTPRIAEVRVGGGSIADQFRYAREILGKEIKVSEVFREGQMVDVVGVSKGKGFQGPVKRFGVAKLHHKSRKRVRGVGTLGPWHPAFVMRTVPRAGQMGFHHRTEYNKQILKVGGDGGEVTPKGGFVRYGPVTSEYVMLKGSVVGPSKRMITLRYAVRSPPTAEPSLRIEQIDVGSKQGA